MIYKGFFAKKVKDFSDEINVFLTIFQRFFEGFS